MDRLARSLALALLVSSCGPGRETDAAAGAPTGDPPIDTRPSDAVNAPVVSESKYLDVLGARIHVLARGSTEERCVLFLHGAAFRAQTWEDLDTLARVAAAGWAVVAVDLPGYGESAECEASPPEFLAALMTALGLERPVVVSPSMSGGFSLPLFARSPELFGGYVPIAPVGADRYRERADAPTIPALVVWGRDDALIPVARGEDFARRITGAPFVVLEDAAHACYLDQPDGFHELLLAFLGGLGDE